MARNNLLLVLCVCCAAMKYLKVRFNVYMRSLGSVGYGFWAVSNTERMNIEINSIF